jgi:hypothetical protein
MLARQKLPFILLCLISNIVQATILTGEGYGKNMEAARNEALATLASSIFVQIDSSSQSYQDSKGEESFNISSRSSTSLPLFGLAFDCYAKGDQFFCIASMDSTRALPLYLQKINELRANLDERMARVDGLPKAQRYSQLQQVAVDYEQFSKYRTVVLYLSEYKTAIPAPGFSQLLVQERMASLETEVASLELAAKLLAREIDTKSLYINPPALIGSHEITPFATALRQALLLELDSTSNPVDADYHYNGQYQLHDKGMRLSYSLSDRQGNTKKAHVIELTPASYRQFRTTALAPDFDALLHKGYAVANDFKAQLNTNKGSSQLQFKRGEIAQLLVKLNKAGYFFIVGHSKSTGLEISYLLDLNEANNNRRFVYYVNSDDVNKWVSIGEFEASPPFGIESIQLIASEKDLINNLPDYHYDSSSGYYVVAENIEKGVDLTRKTRGLKKKKNTLVAETTETVLLFTTED